MWYKCIFPTVLFVMLFTSCNNKKDISASQFSKPPMAAKKDSVLTIHEHQRVDPYFWLRLSDEQKEAKEPDEQTKEVFAYLNAENSYTKEVLKETEALQESIYQEIIGRIKQDDESLPYFKNGYWYYSKYEEGQEYQIYCRKKESLENEEEILINANERAEGLNYYDLGNYEISPDNRWMAFSEDTLSRRIYTIRFKNLETGRILDKEIENTTGHGAWGNDNKTFFYTTKDQLSLLSKQVWRHQIDEDQSSDELIYEEEDPAYYIGVYKSKSDQYVIIWNQSTLSSDYYLVDANQPTQQPRQFTAREDVHEYYIEHFEDKFYIKTNWKAKNFRLMESSEMETSKELWKEVIPHREDVLLDDFEVFGKHLVITERKKALNYLRIIDQKSQEEHYIHFDESAYVVETSTNPEFNTSLLRFSYSSLTTPRSIYDYNMDDRSKILKKQQEVVGGHHPEDYTTERHFARARDGKEIPISLVYKNNVSHDGSAPLLLYAYGSYGNTIDPYFNSSRLSLLDRGFIFAIAHIRGGQAMGREWYDEGRMFNKMNTFNDYIDCSEYLIANDYTSPEHLYAMGGSAGGLLMGAVVNMRPDLYNGLVASVPFVDVVSTMLDETIPLTTNEFDEWGNPKNKESYFYMLSYSPYDQVKEREYPHMLVTSGLFDSQVQYWEPAKWVAKLRDHKTDNNLLLLHINMDAGHGGASGRFQQYKEVAMEYVFLLMLEGKTD